MHTTSSEISIIGTNFTDNRAMSSFVAYMSVVSINRTLFKYNDAYGSAVELSKSIVDIYNSVYDSNNINHQGIFHLCGGSALSSCNRTRIHIYGCEFKNNTAKIRGGAIF